MNVNKVFLGGRLTKDPDARYTSGGTAIVNFNVATTRNWTKDGEKKEETCFVEASAFGKTGETIANYLKKGNPIFIEGRLKFEQWEKDGQKHSKLKVVVDSFQFVSGARGEKKTESVGSSDDIDDEDIPF